MNGWTVPRALERGLFRIAVVALAVTVVMLVQRELSRNGSDAEVLSAQAGPGALVVSGLGERAIGVVAEAEGRFAVLEPRSGETVTDWKVNISGIGPPETLVTNGANSATVDDDGSWVMPVILFRGQNDLEFRNGSTGADISVTLIYDPDADETSETTDSEADSSGSTTTVSTSESNSPSPGTTAPARAANGGVELASGAPNANGPQANNAANKNNANQNRAAAAEAAAARTAAAKAANQQSTTTTTPTSRVAVSRSDTPTPVASPTPAPTPTTAAAPKATAPAPTPPTPARTTPTVPAPAAANSQTRTASPR